jgi:hypothetical protein
LKKASEAPRLEPSGTCYSSYFGGFWGSKDSLLSYCYLCRMYVEKGEGMSIKKTILRFDGFIFDGEVE